jgi:hypothetical protein
MAVEGYGKLKVYLAKKNIEINWMHTSLVGLILLLLLLLALGYR